MTKRIWANSSLLCSIGDELVKCVGVFASGYVWWELLSHPMYKFK